MTADHRLDAAARALAMIEPGEDWPTNEALGGSMTGTRDDEFRDGMFDQAKAALDAADYADGEQSIQRVKVDDESLERMARAIHASAPGGVRTYEYHRQQWLTRANAALAALVDVTP